MYVSSLIPKDRLRSSLRKIQDVLSPDEEVMAVFAVTRFKRMVDTLAITSGRVLTLGNKLTGIAVVDDIPARAIKSVRVGDQGDGFSAGKVQVVTDEGEVFLGVIAAGKKNDQTERVSAEVLILSLIEEDFHTAALPTKPDSFQVYPARIDIDEGSGHRGALLIEQLNELASLHSQGKLTDEEFASAKAAVIVAL